MERNVARRAASSSSLDLDPLRDRIRDVNVSYCRSMLADTRVTMRRRSREAIRVIEDRQDEGDGRTKHRM